MVGNNEWSGELITREEGTITDLEDWKIIAEDIFLADIGTGAYTEYNVDRGGFKAVDVIELYETYPGLEDGSLKCQHLHTHINFQCFFSGTDWEQLEDRACCSNYVLMLIVNMKGDAIAKVAFKAVKEGGTKTKFTFANNADGYGALTLGKDEAEDVLVIMDCKVEIEETEVVVDASFKERYERVRVAIEEEKKAEEEAKKKTKPVYNQGSLPYGKYNGGTLWDSEKEENLYNPYGDWTREWEETNGVWHKKEKKISDMTDAEFVEYEESEAAEKVFQQDQIDQTKFEERDAAAFLNSIFDSSYALENYKDVKEKLLVENKKLDSDEEMEKWVDEWQLMLQEHFDVIFRYSTIEQYVDVLSVVQEHLKQYKYIRLCQEMIDAIEEEMEMCTIAKGIII